MEQTVGPEEPTDAATAFDALRREVALLNVAIAGLAAERATVPDYSETLGEISKGVSVAISRLGKVMMSPALATEPAQMARQIVVAAETRGIRTALCSSKRRRCCSRRREISRSRLRARVWQTPRTVDCFSWELPV